MYYVPAMHAAVPPAVDSANESYPARCPRCDADWGRCDTIKSPIRTLRTGFQKITQVLADMLLRRIVQPGREQSRKLVVFSDSRPVQGHRGWAIGVVEVAAHRVTYLILELIERVGIGEDRCAKRPRRVPSLRCFCTQQQNVVVCVKFCKLRS